MSEVFKICCSIHRRENRPSIAQVLRKPSETLSYQDAIRFTGRNIRAKTCAMLFHLYNFAECFMQSEIRAIAAPGQTTGKEDEEMEIVGCVSSGQCLVN